MFSAVVSSTKDVSTRAAVAHVGTFLAYAYLLRVPLLTCALLVALPIVALPRDAIAGPLLRGLFDVADPGAPWWTGFATFGLLTLAAFFVAAAISITARLILLDGHERFSLAAVKSSPGLQLMVRLVPLAAATTLVSGAWIQSWPTTVRGVSSAALGTAAGFGVFVFLLTVVHDWLWDRMFVEKRPFLTPIKLFAVPAGLLLRALAAVVRLTPEGFVDRSTNQVRARHVFALLQFLVSLAFYVAVFIVKSSPVYVGGGQPTIPTLCLVLVLAMLACWALTGLTFLFDRFRVPLLTVLFAYGSVMSLFPWNDHFFQTVNPEPQRVPSVPADGVLKHRARKPAIVIAAAGGGIQAAAWTSRVIAGLQQDSHACGDDFDEALVALSAVSGGSVGAMYIVDAYRSGHLDAQALTNAVSAAEASSLDEVAWGLTYPDLVWTIFPFLKPIYPPFLVKDRGSALEDAWKRSDTLNRATLDLWRADVSARVRPAVLFNATVAESGQRMLFATTTLETASTDVGRREFALDFPDLDVPVTTAARLSATFPYVSPAARVNRNAGFDAQYHYVDGGYYDNYATATIVEWLRLGLSKLQTDLPNRVLIVEVRSFPNSAAAGPRDQRGWTADLLQPLLTLSAVRGAGQAAHSDLNVSLLEDGGSLVSHVPITFPARIFEDQDDASPPLSWHLTPRDRGLLADAWHDPDVLDARRRIHRFLGLADDQRADCIIR
jgi:hypothetical protein